MKVKRKNRIFHDVSGTLHPGGSPGKYTMSQLRQMQNRAAHNIRKQVLETQLNIMHSFVDPRDVFNVDGETWLPIGSDQIEHQKMLTIFTNPAEHKLMRDSSRRSYAANEFAINALDNRANYIVGKGYTYKVEPKPRKEVAQSTIDRMQDAVDDLLKRLRWSQIESECVIRFDRDGEVFLRIFDTEDGPVVRFVEPEQVITPTRMSETPSASFGIQTNPRDSQDIIGYYITENGRDEPQLVPAEDVFHLKANVDQSVKRGVSSLFSIRKNLERAEKLLRNMSLVAAIQAAIAYIRKFDAASENDVDDFMDSERDITVSDASTGKTFRYQKIGAAEIINAPKGIDYEFPAVGINADFLVGILQAELRAIAARFIMPEYMLSSNASNSNLASSLAAESPFVRSIERIQLTFGLFFVEIIESLLNRSGRVVTTGMRRLLINDVPPNLIVRDTLKENKAKEILRDNQVLSPQTWAQQEGLDYDIEQERFDNHIERTKDRMAVMGAEDGQGQFGQDDPRMTGPQRRANRRGKMQTPPEDEDDNDDDK